MVTLFAEKYEPAQRRPKTIDIYIRVGHEVIADFTGTPMSGDAPLSVQFTDLSTQRDQMDLGLRRRGDLDS